MSLNKFLNISEDSDWWDDAIKIYDDSFPEWEKEDIENISANIANGRYKMVVYISNNSSN